MERRKKIALELSDLVIYCRPVPFDEDSKYASIQLNTLSHTQAYLTPHLPPCSCRDWDRAGVFPGHVVVPGDQGREVCEPDQGEEVLAVQPAAAVPYLPSWTEAGLLQLRPSAHVALWIPAGRAELPDCRYRGMSCY